MGRLPASRNWRPTKYLRFLSLAAVFLGLIVGGLPPAQAGGGAAVGTVESAVASITGAELRNYVFLLADPAFEGREAGTPAAQKAAQWLAEELSRLGLVPAGHDGSFFQPFRDGMFNVLGMVRGSDPALAEEVILVGAHFDHIGFGRRREGEPRVYPGADDNASGVAAVLELAEALTLLPVGRSVLFALWDGEEKGLLGSRHWVKEPTLPIQKVKVAINLDMVGRLREDRLYLVGTRSGVGWRRLFVLQNEEGLRLAFSWNMRPDSDHISFFDAGIPSVMFHTGLHEDYHRPTDTADRINYEGMERVVRYAFRVIYDLASRENLPAYRPEAREEEPWKDTAAALPRLGLEFREEPDSGPALAIRRVAPSSPAEAAGLEAGDRVLGINGREGVTVEEFVWMVASAEEAVEIILQKAEEPTRRLVRIPLRGGPMPFGMVCREDPADPGVAVVLEVLPASPAAMAGIRRDDRIWEIDGKALGENPVQEIADSARRWLVDPQAARLELTIEREGRALRVPIIPPSRN